MTNGPREEGDSDDPIRAADATIDALAEGRAAVVRDAYEVASRAHAGRRKESDDRPELEHALAVGRLLHETAFDDEVVAAALLHDTVEDAGLPIAELRERFGPAVADLVATMTEPEALEPFEARKTAHRERLLGAGREAQAIFVADKVVNAAQLRAAIATQGEEAVAGRTSKPLERKVEHYEAALEMLETVAADLPLLPRLRTELRLLREERT